MDEQHDDTLTAPSEPGEPVDAPGEDEDGDREPLTGTSEFRASLQDARAKLRALRTSDLATKRQLLGDVVALAPLVAMLLWMSTHDGGNEQFFFRVATIVVLVASPVALLEARALPRAARWLLGAYAFGLVVALAFAGDRNEWVPATLVLTTVPICGLAAHRIWRRPWGPLALLVLLGLTFGSYFYRSFLAWWGDTMLGRVPLWRPLSWHNQSAMLMGAFGVLGLGLAGVGRRFVAGIGVAFAAFGLAGAWLSGSRGALIATALGVAVAAVGAVRAGGARHLLPVAGGLVAAVIVVAGLNGMIQDGAVIQTSGDQFEGNSTNPLENRSRTAGTNFQARLRHMQAAMGMFLDDPVTGEGPGSYRRLAPEHTPRDANLTASAHNEYLEVLAEGGLLTGVGFLGLHALFAVAALGAVWRRREIGDDEARGPMQVGFAALVVAIGAHAAVDFDWTFPVLPVLLAVGAAGLSQVGRDDEVTAPDAAAAPLATDDESGEPTGTGTDAGADAPPVRRRGRLAWLVVAPLTLLLAASVWGAARERAVASGGDDLAAEEFAALPLGWQGDRLSQHALTLSRAGEHELAASAIQEALRWSPDVRGYQGVAQIVLYRAGAIDADQLSSRLEQIEPGFGTRNLAAEALIDRGDLEPARRLTEDLLATYADFVAQGIDAVRAETWYLRAEVEAVAGDCEAAAAQIERSVERGDVPEAFVAREFGPLVLQCPGIVPGVRTQSG